MSYFSHFNGVPINDELLERVAWGFVLVRCNADDERWSSFLSALKQQNNMSDKLTQSQPWTIIEDKDNLTNATMLQASLAFQVWVDTTGVHENLHPLVPRHQYFIYVNEESIESIVNPNRAHEKTGNFLVLVDASWHIQSCNETQASFRNDINSEQDIRDVLADTVDSSWKLIPTTDFKNTYLTFWTDPDPWHQYSNEFQSAPYVYHRFPASTVADDLIESPEQTGFDVYKMLKQIYGRNHPRSVCFETDEAQTGLQRKSGYAGGYRREEYTEPMYL